MSRARHKEHEKRARGGGLSSEPKWNAGGEQNAAKEAEEKKRGGGVHHHGEGEHSKHRADKRARGGHVGHEEMHKHVKKQSMVHKGRARGGRIGANLMPLSTAARVKHVTPGEQPEEGGPGGETTKLP